ncbi:MAG: hypothetical protein JO006_04910 [Paucibacter sp.]|nr:hypothetical protein [Roseateles sp.]
MSFIRTSIDALSKTLQWRLLLLWACGVALPTLIASLPIFISLNQALGHSLSGAQLLDGLDPGVLGDTLIGLLIGGFTPVGSLGSLIVFVLLLPWLGGMLVAVARADRALYFGELAMAGWREYGRMARLWIWALVPLAAAIGIGAALFNWADEHAAKQVLEADADFARHVALGVSLALLLFVSATLDAARARFARELHRRSAVKAWWAGFKDVLRRPRWWLIYVLLSLVGAALAAVFGWARVQLAPVGTWSFLADLLLAQCVVMALAWGRAARVVAFADEGLLRR